MIGIFRKIRRLNIAGNKASRYLLYALGEIILVVIGILIALEVNNWNETRKDKRQEAYILRQLYEEFTQDSVVLQNHARLSGGKKERGQILKKYLRSEIILDTLDIVPPAFFNGKIVTFNSYTPTYEELVSSGQLRLLSNPELKEAIFGYKAGIEGMVDFNYKEGQLRKEDYNAHLHQYFDAEIMTYLWHNTRRNNLNSVTTKGLSQFYMDILGFKNDPKSLYFVQQQIGVDAELEWTYAGVRMNQLRKILRILEKEMERTTTNP